MVIYMNDYDVGIDYRGFAYTHNHATTTTSYYTILVYYTELKQFKQISLEFQNHTWI